MPNYLAPDSLAAQVIQKFNVGNRFVYFNTLLLKVCTLIAATLLGTHSLYSLCNESHLHERCKVQSLT